MDCSNGTHLCRSVDELLRIDELPGYDELMELKPDVKDAFLVWACLREPSELAELGAVLDAEKLVCGFEVPIVLRTLRSLQIQADMSIKPDVQAFRALIAEDLRNGSRYLPGISAWARGDEEELLATLCEPNGQTLWDTAGRIQSIAEDFLSFSDLARLIGCIWEGSYEYGLADKFEYLIPRLGEIIVAIEETSASNTLRDLTSFCHLLSRVPIAIVADCAPEQVAEVYEALWRLWADTQASPTLV